MLPREVVERILREHRDGATLRTIAAGLIDEEQTARCGATWLGSAVRAASTVRMPPNFGRSRDAAKLGAMDSRRARDRQRAV